MKDSVKRRSGLVDLPTELLVYTFSFLSAVRDKVALYYVSRRIRSAIEVPSLWKKFVWSYDSREERCVSDFLQTYGKYAIKTLSFPDHVSSILLHTVRYCHNVVELSLPLIKLDRVQVGTIVQHMQRLQKFDTQWSFGLMRLLVMKSQIKELTLRVDYDSYYWNWWNSKPNRKFRISVNLFLFLITTRNLKFLPQSINIVLFQCSPSTAWPKWKVTLPAGHIIDVRVYRTMISPLDLFSPLPEFQFKFGAAIAFPNVYSNKFGLVIPGYGYYITDHVVGNTAEFKASLNSSYSNQPQYNQINFNIMFVTELDFSFCELINSDHLEVVSKICPNLKRLNLCRNYNCLKSLKGLRTIASCCHNLQGLNLFGIQLTEIENHMWLWEILSSMRLTHLEAELCIIIPFEGGDNYKQNLMEMFQKCSDLQALGLRSGCGMYCTLELCSSCAKLNDDHIRLLSKFPSLIYCHITLVKTYLPNVVNILLTSCKEIKYFYLVPLSNFPIPLSFSSELNVCNLQQLCLMSLPLDIPDSFMTAVSAHGQLVNVIFMVTSVSHEGVVALIANSPELLALIILLEKAIPYVDESDLKKRFAHRRLFDSDSGFSCGEMPYTSQGDLFEYLQFPLFTYPQSF